MIVPCPECNGKVSDTVPACPHCGFAMKPAPPDDFEEVDRVACPYCAEPIHAAATICPHCRGPVSHGKAVHPAQRRGPAKHVPTPRSFTSLAVICALLYLLCWPLSLILNIFWYNEAGSIERETGQEPEGKGCLLATLIVGILLLGLLFIGFFAGRVERL